MKLFTESPSLVPEKTSNMKGSSRIHGLPGKGKWNRFCRLTAAGGDGNRRHKVGRGVEGEMTGVRVGIWETKLPGRKSMAVTISRTPNNEGWGS